MRPFVVVICGVVGGTSIKEKIYKIDWAPPLLSISYQTTTRMTGSLAMCTLRRCMPQTDFIASGCVCLAGWLAGWPTARTICILSLRWEWTRWQGDKGNLINIINCSVNEVSQVEGEDGNGDSFIPSLPSLEDMELRVARKLWKKILGN